VSFGSSVQYFEILRWDSTAHQGVV